MVRIFIYSISFHDWIFYLSTLYRSSLTQTAQNTKQTSAWTPIQFSQSQNRIVNKQWHSHVEQLSGVMWSHYKTSHWFRRRRASAVDNWSWRSLPPPSPHTTTPNINQTNLFLLRLAKRRVGLDLDTVLSQYISLKSLPETERFSWRSARIPESMTTGRHYNLKDI